MRIEIIGKNYNPSEKLKDIIEKKTAKLDRYFDDDAKCRVYLKEKNKTSKMEITIDYKGGFMRAEALGDNYYDNIDLLLPKIEKQIYKYRTKLEKKLRTNAFKEQNIWEIDEDELRPDKIVKIKKFRMTPMTVDEAVAELDLIGHAFYVFQEEKSGEIRVVYRRDDGDVGLIEPQLA